MSADKSATCEFIVIFVVFCESGFDCCAAFVGLWSDYCREEVQHEQGHIFLEVPRN